MHSDLQIRRGFEWRIKESFENGIEALDQVILYNLRYGEY
jgi:hypothetical protein